MGVILTQQQPEWSLSQTLPLDLFLDGCAEHTSKAFLPTTTETGDTQVLHGGQVVLCHELGAMQVYSPAPFIP